MKVKAFVLIFLIAFAIVASTTFVELSNNRSSIEKRIDSANTFRIVPIDDNETVTQREIDTPGMPG